MESLGLKSINMLSKEQYENIEQPAHDELYVVSHSGIGFPSSNYDDLELGASGTVYTAPGNGWFVFDKASNSNGQYGALYNSGINNDAIINIAQNVISTTSNLGLTVAAKKGDKVHLDYNLGGALICWRFVYAEGE